MVGDKKPEVKGCGAYYRYINVGTSRQLIEEMLAVGLYIQNFKMVPNIHLYRSLGLQPRISHSHDTFTRQYLLISWIFLSGNEAD